MVHVIQSFGREGYCRASFERVDYNGQEPHSHKMSASDISREAKERSHASQGMGLS